MKYLYIAVVLSAFQLYTTNAAATATESTINCASCPTTTSSMQYVTRTSAPTISCSAPVLTAIYSTSGTSASGVATPVPFTGAGSKMVGSMSGALAMAIAAVYAM